MKRSLFAVAALLLAIAPAARAEETSSSAPPPKPRLEIRTLRVAEVKGDKLALEVTWSYVEQDNLRPSQFDIIAILVGAHDKKLTAKATVAVPASGPIPLSGKALIALDEPFTAPRDVKFTVSVSPKIPGIQDGTSNTFVARKEAVLRVEP